MEIGLKEINNKTIKKSLLDKRRQNFRIHVLYYILKDNNNLYYRKKLNINSDTLEEQENNIKDKKIDVNNNKNTNDQYKEYKIPFEIEKQHLLNNIHIKTGHTVYHRLYDEINNKNYFWKGIIQDCKDYVNLCPICTKNRGGIPLKLIQKQIMDGKYMIN